MGCLEGMSATEIMARMKSAPKITLRGGELDGKILPDMGDREIRIQGHFDPWDTHTYLKSDDGQNAYYLSTANSRKDT